MTPSALQLKPRLSTPKNEGRSRTSRFLPALACASLLALPAFGAEETVRFITLDPGHFHAGLVQKFMYPQVSPVVRVYTPGGAELQDHLARIESFNTRADNPTHWQEKVYTGPDYLERMVQEKAGNVVVISGNNRRKTEYIDESIKAGLNVLADKPMAITPAGFTLLRQACETAAARHVLLYDIMTERYEITTMLQRELAHSKAVFGSLQKGSPSEPAVVMESVHHYFKEVAGKPLIRPAWFYDVRQQGEGIPDIGTHLVDGVNYICFPEQSLSWKKDVKVFSAHRWPTIISPEQFRKTTALESYPDYLKPDVGPDGSLRVFANGDVTYSVRGIHAKVTTLWRFEAPPGAKDTHYAIVRGTRANLVIEQGPAQKYLPILYVDNKSS
ncbi:MAG TPA: putative oxidoreductase C-terminal domain-containing protein, partial [Geobacteraceae bacterium]